MFSSQKYGVSLVKVKVTVAILDSLYVEKVVFLNQLLNFCLCNNAGTIMWEGLQAVHVKVTTTMYEGQS